MQILKRYLKYLQNNQLNDYNYPTLSGENISQFEKKNGIKLPPLLWEIYQRFGGQGSQILNECPYRLLPLAEIPVVQKKLLQHIETVYGEDWKNHRINDFDDIETVQNILYHPLRIPIFQNDNDDYYCLDFSPAAGGKKGQVIAVISDPEPDDEHLFLMFKDIEECLEDILEDLESNDPKNLSDFFSESQETLRRFGEDAQLNEYGTIENFNSMMKFYQGQVNNHIIKYFGKIDGEFSTSKQRENEQPMKLLYIAPDINERPFHTFMTSGMSAQAMKMPQNMSLETWARFHRAELMIYLPMDWKLTDESLSDPNYNWPLQWLDIVANLPRYANTWLMAGKVLNIESGDQIGSTNFGGFFIAPPIHLESDFSELITHHGEYIYFYTLVPLYPEEIEVEQKKGIDQLLALMQKHEINALIDPNRPNCAL